jgi:hypothetical protein
MNCAVGYTYGIELKGFETLGDGIAGASKGWGFIIQGV